ncbi:hypothetical protein [Zooshikella harenae]|uniref:WYL domain-containing protein n=1 Tax=Zooshikella harenae TaxID=2827238 RepID=A0ABS5ZJX7_9GAMM|nr:hypothetical protein [Zooshikella harenae]MBU2714193.1 hypothetical protein [Zooshikella harenae]
MAISKKNRRTLIHKGIKYLWWIIDEFDPYTGDSLLVTVASEDKKFIVKYYINQAHNGRRFLTVIGPEFSCDTITGGVWKRFACPKFEEERIFKPKSVVKLIDWCLDPKLDKVEVDYLGKEVSQ